MMENQATDQAATPPPPSRVHVDRMQANVLPCEDVLEEILPQMNVEDNEPTLAALDAELTEFAPSFSDEFIDSDTETELVSLTQHDAELDTTADIDITANEIKERMRAYPFALCNLAMPFQYFVSGFVGAIITGILYGVLIGRMSVDANHYVTSQAVVLVPWGFKCCVGFLSDNFALLGRRRVYYCVMGHLVVLFTFAGLAIFYEDPLEEYCDLQSTSFCNKFATRHVRVLVICFMVTCTGLMLSESACDGLMIQVCKEQSGPVQKAKVASTCFIIRFVGAATAATLLLFTHDLPPVTIFVICAILSSMCMFLWLQLSQYDKPHKHEYGNQIVCYDSSASQLFVLFCTPRFTKFMVYNLLAPILVNITSPSMDGMRIYWSPTGHQQFTFVISSVFTILLLTMITTWFPRAKWLHIVLTTTTVTVCLTLPISVFATLDICRSEYLFLLQDVLQPLPAASMYLVATLATVDIAPPGQEATIYGLVTTSHILAIPSAKSVANILYAQIPIFFDITDANAFFDQQNYTDDSLEFRQAVVVSVVISASATMLSQLLLLLLPSNKARATDEEPSHKYGILTGLAILPTFTVGMSLNLLSMIPHVRCSGAIVGIGCLAAPVTH